MTGGQRRSDQDLRRISRRAGPDQGVRPYGEGARSTSWSPTVRSRGSAPAWRPAGAEVIEATGQVLLPGLVDLHTHLREPGREYAEDIETGSAAAALGGYTAVFAMANTDPVADSPVVTDHVWQRGRQVGLVDVHPVGRSPSAWPADNSPRWA